MVLVHILPPIILADRHGASPAQKPTSACSPVKRWLLAMHSMAAVPLRTFDSAARATVAGKQRPGRRNRRSDRTKKQSWKKSRDARYERHEPIAQNHRLPPSLRRSRQPSTKVPLEIRQLIRTMSLANPLWGAPRIHGELLKLGIDIGQTSVAKYMAKGRAPPSQGWKTFLRNHVNGIVAIDLFVVPTLSFRLLYGLVVLRLDRRQILWLGVTAHPSAEWMALSRCRTKNAKSLRLGQFQAADSRTWNLLPVASA